MDPHEGVLDDLFTEAEGKITRAIGRLEDLGPPLQPTPGIPLPSQILEELRRDER